ncbi:MAG: AAA family ATPase, partial [Planctomycetota bacterium]
MPSPLSTCACLSRHAASSSDLRDTSASAYDLSLATIACLAGWRDQQVADLLVASRRTHDGHAGKALRRDYVVRTLAKAREAATPHAGEADIDAAIEKLAPKRGPRPVPVAELLADHPELREPVIHGLLRQGETMNVIAPSKFGKALAIDTPILAEHGWTTMGELEVGMRVHAGDGSLTRIVAVSEIMHGRPCREVRTKTGARIVADESHLWTVVHGNGTHIRTTRDLAPSGLRGHRWKLPVSGCIERPPADLPIDPWVLGYWLGNGTTVNGEVTVAAEDLQFVQDQLSRAGFERGRIWHKVGAASFTVLGLRVKLRELGVLGNKHVPPSYLLAAPWQRKMLLSGLLDSDGHGGTARNGSGCARYASSSATLARDVRFLIRSLGHKVFASSRPAKYYDKVCGTCHTLMFAASASDTPFASPRKTGGLPARSIGKRSNVDAVLDAVPVESVPVRCIQVEHPDGTFLAGPELTVTHNSWLLLDLVTSLATGRPWLDSYPVEKGRVLILDNELHEETIASRIPRVAEARGVPLRDFASNVDVASLRGGLEDVLSLAPWVRRQEPGRWKLVVL